MKIFNITNVQGAYLMSVKAKNAKNALRQARKIWYGKLVAVELSHYQPN